MNSARRAGDSAPYLTDLAWLLAFKPMHRGALEFPVRVALFDVIALVVLHLAFAEAE